MYKCRFYNKDKSNCTILANTKCSEKCKFRKTNAEFYEGIKHAEEILERNVLHPVLYILQIKVTSWQQWKLNEGGERKWIMKFWQQINQE